MHPIRRSLAAFCALGLLALPARADVPRVAVDIAPVHSLVAQVMGAAGTPELILPPGASPHGYSMRPSEARALSEADLVIWMGPALAPWMVGALDRLSGEAAVLDLMGLPGTRRLEVRDEVPFAPHDHDHGHDHGHDDHGHGEGGIDPHGWLDPDNAAVWLEAIAEALAAEDPDGAERYRANAAAARAALSEEAAAIEARMAPLSDLRFLVFHDAYQYFETRFGLSATGSVALSDARDPGPRRLIALREEIAERRVDCALAEPQFDPGLLAAVLGGTEVTLGIVDPMGSDIPTGPDFYAALLTRMADSFAACRDPAG